MRHIKNSARGSWQILWLLLLLVGLASFGLVNSRNLLLNNARTLGSNLVSSYSNDEDSQLNEYDRILTMAMYYLEDMDDEGVDIDGFKQWLTDYFEKSSTLLHASSLDIYAVLRGQVISTNGILDVYMKNFNGMSLSEYEVIDILDDGAPELVSYDVNEGILSLTVKDTQSGIDYTSLHATTPSGTVIQPLSVDQSNGLITFQLEPEGLTVSIKDLSGNEYLPTFSVVTEAAADGSSVSGGQVMVQ